LQGGSRNTEYQNQVQGMSGAGYYQALHHNPSVDINLQASFSMGVLLICFMKSSRNISGRSAMVQRLQCIGAECLPGHIPYGTQDRHMLFSF
jgi:hypothetical protein